MRWHTRGALVTVVQTCALPILRLRGAEPVVRVARGRTGRSGVGGDVRSDYGGLAGPMSKALKTVGLVLGGVALVATGIGAIAGAGTFLGVAGSTFRPIGAISGVASGLDTFAAGPLTTPHAARPPTPPLIPPPNAPPP